MSSPHHRNYVQRLVGDVRLLALGSRQQTDAEFEEHLAEAIAMGPSVRRVIVAIQGAPTMSADRRAKLDRAGLLVPPTAVLSDSPLIRGILTALCWLGANARPFPPNGVEQACEFLGVPSLERPALTRELSAMFAELTGDSERAEPHPNVGLVALAEQIKRAVGVRSSNIRGNGSK
ncbi:MAG: hypothetical protein QM756_25750 [Polyangiaceae bacterium]